MDHGIRVQSIGDLDVTSGLLLGSRFQALLGPAFPRSSAAFLTAKLLVRANPQRATTGRGPPFANSARWALDPATRRGVHYPCVGQPLPMLDFYRARSCMALPIGSEDALRADAFPLGNHGLRDTRIPEAVFRERPFRTRARESRSRTNLRRRHSEISLYNRARSSTTPFFRAAKPLVPPIDRRGNSHDQRIIDPRWCESA